MLLLYFIIIYYNQGYLAAQIDHKFALVHMIFRAYSCVKYFVLFIAGDHV